MNLSSEWKYQTPDHIKEVINFNKDKESFYIYDLEMMKYKMDTLKVLDDNVDTYYAMKVNPHLSVVKEALKHKNITWIEVASKWEIDIVREAQQMLFLEKQADLAMQNNDRNFENSEDSYLNNSNDLSKVIYTWPSKKPEEIEISVQSNIKYLNVESWTEAIRVDMEAKKKWVVQPILMRLNTKHKFDEWETWVTLWSWDTQFGFPQDETVKFLKDLDKLENIRVEGFHMYPATGIMEASVLLRSVDETFRFVREVQNKTKKEFKTIDFGWGFWVDYGWFKEFNIEEYAEGLSDLIKKYDMKDKTLILELGRYLWADMGYFVTKINDIKTLKSWAKWVLCNAWTNALKRPQVLNVNYHMDIVHVVDEMTNKILEISKELWRPIDVLIKKDIFNVYGPFCTSVDKILWDKTWFDANVWDYVVVPQAWAYGKTMSPQEFLSHPEIEEIIIDENYFK